MSYRNTLILLVALSLIAGYVYFFELRKSPPPVERPPWVYSVDLMDIASIDLHYEDKNLSIIWDDEEGLWHFKDPSPGELELNQASINGLRVLLSGTISKRLLFEKVEDLSVFGLDEPQIVARVGLKSGQVMEIVLGDKTPDEQGYYVQFRGWDYIYTVDYTWGDEFIRFVTEPPLVTPTATPSDTAASG